MKRLLQNFVNWVSKRFHKKKSEDDKDNPYNYPLF